VIAAANQVEAGGAFDLAAHRHHVGMLGHSRPAFQTVGCLVTAVPYRPPGGLLQHPRCLGFHVVSGAVDRLPRPPETGTGRGGWPTAGLSSTPGFVVIAPPDRGRAPDRKERRSDTAEAIDCGQVA